MFRGATKGFVWKNWFYLTLQTLLHPWLLVNHLFLNRLSTVGHIIRRSIRKENPKITSEIKHAAKSCAILSIAVNPAVQGQGVGKKLVTAVDLWAHEQQYTQIHLTVHPENKPAVAFYKKLGFIEEPFTKDWSGLMIRPILETDARQPG